ncbi:MAG: FAD-dependent oxidoreductase [Myxococcota bacterium]
MKSKNERALISRRGFLERAGKAGVGAVGFGSMAGLAEWAGPPTARADLGNGRTVLILGAGISGLATAYLLSRSGFRCEILEASGRAGGRSLTVRDGDTIVEHGPNGETWTQQCEFDRGLYANMGPARIPYHHRRVLGYCRSLGVELEPYLMSTTANLYQDQVSGGFGGVPIQFGRIQNDTRGHLASLLAEAVNRGDIGGGAADALKSLISSFGDLGEDGMFGGTTRSGCEPDALGVPTPNVFEACGTPDALSLRELVGSEFWNEGFYNVLTYTWQNTLFQPVGGMDMIVKGFLREVGDMVVYNSRVTSVDSAPDGVEVIVERGGREVRRKADFCVSSIPAHLLRSIDNNFSAEFDAALSCLEPRTSFKVAWQANDRFWESDDNQIYGGISRMRNTIREMWYPSSGHHEAKGVLIGGYDNTPSSAEFSALRPEERLRIAHAEGARLHPEFRQRGVVPAGKGLTLAWGNFPHIHTHAMRFDGPDEARFRLLEPDGRFFIMGCQVSHLPAWQEGALTSAEHVTEQIFDLAG